MRKPIAVIISDVHVDIPTLGPAIASLRQAIDKASEIKVPLIVAGDLHNTKANMRAECVNAMIETFSELSNLRKHYILIGNHDLLNEKAKEHSLNFLYKEETSNDDGICIIDTPRFINDFTLNGNSPYFIPYQHDPRDFLKILNKIDKNSLIIIHQGVHGSNSGEYIQDKSAVPKEWLADYRVISGHYHTRQDIKCGPIKEKQVGLMSYIGNPYTLNFAEANDPEKGFQILNDDGTLEFVPTNLRKHIVINITCYKDTYGIENFPKINKEDLVKVKASGTKEQLSKLTKEYIKTWQPSLFDFKLELNITDNDISIQKPKLEPKQTLDDLIDSTQYSEEQKLRLKDLWRSSCE